MSKCPKCDIDLSIHQSIPRRSASIRASCRKCWKTYHIDSLGLAYETQESKLVRHNFRDVKKGKDARPDGVQEEMFHGQ